MFCQVQVILKVKKSIGGFSQFPSQCSFGRKLVGFINKFEGNNSQKNSNQNQSKSNLNIGAGIPNIKTIHSKDLSSLKQITKQNIPKKISPVTNHFAPGTDRLAKFGETSAAANQAADKLTDSPAKDLNAAFLSLTAENNRINNNLSKNVFFVNLNEGKWTLLNKIRQKNRNCQAGVRIYNYALTSDQVKNLYNGGAAMRFAPITGTP